MDRPDNDHLAGIQAADLRGQCLYGRRRTFCQGKHHQALGRHNQFSSLHMPVRSRNGASSIHVSMIASRSRDVTPLQIPIAWENGGSFDHYDGSGPRATRSAGNCPRQSGRSGERRRRPPRRALATKAKFRPERRGKRGVGPPRPPAGADFHFSHSRSNLEVRLAPDFARSPSCSFTPW